MSDSIDIMLKIRNAMKWIIIGIVLLILGIEDARERQVWIGWIYALLLVGIVGALNTILAGTMTAETTSMLLFGCVPGIFVLFTSCLAKKHVGTGDGYTLVALGFSVGIKNMLIILFWGGIASVVMAVVTLLFLQRNRQLPFLLSLVVGYGMLLVTFVF